MDIRTLAIVFYALGAAMLAVWMVESARLSKGTKSLLLCGLLMAALGWILPLVM